MRRLGCLRGLSNLTALALAIEIGDWHPFTGNTIGAYVGLVTSEYSSGWPLVQGRSPIASVAGLHVGRSRVSGNPLLDNFMGPEGTAQAVPVAVCTGSNRRILTVAMRSMIEPVV